MENYTGIGYIDIDDDNYYEIDSIGRYMLVYYKNDFYIVDSENGDVIAALDDEEEQWSKFVEEHTPKEKKETSVSDYNLPKSTTIGKLRTKYPKYKGPVYTLTNGLQYYCGSNHSFDITDDVIVYFDKNDAEEKTKYTSLKSVIKLSIFGNGRYDF